MLMRVLMRGADEEVLMRGADAKGVDEDVDGGVDEGC